MSENEPLFLGVDAGGTRTRAVLMSGQGEILGRGDSGPANDLTGPQEVARSSLQQAIRAATRNRRTRNGRISVRGLGIGSAALVCRGSLAHAEELLGGTVEYDAIVLDSDALVAWAGAFACRPGIVVIAGTGSICLGAIDHQNRFRVGGWGWRFGDEGSAYGIAAQGIRLALRAADGRLAERQLWERLREFVGLETKKDEPPFETTPREVEAWLYHPARTATTIASFAPAVDTAARRGSVLARNLLVDAGRELAHMATTVAARLPLAPPIHVAPLGGVLTNSSIVRNSFVAALRETLVDVELCEPSYPAEVGAALLAMQASEHALPTNVDMGDGGVAEDTSSHELEGQRHVRTGR